jgi:hypothetical protein
VNDQRAANAARVRALTVGLVVSGVVGTGALGGLAWAQDHAGDADSSGGTDPGTAPTTAGTANRFGGPGRADNSSTDSWNSGGATTTWPQLGSGGGSSHTRSAGS